MDADLFDEWFRIADRDRDGKVSGAEAVDFFQKSGLSKETLFEASSCQHSFGSPKKEPLPSLDTGERCRFGRWWRATTLHSPSLNSLGPCA